MEFYLKSFQNILDSHKWLGEVVVMAMLTCPTEVSIQSQAMFQQSVLKKVPPHVMAVTSQGPSRRH